MERFILFHYASFCKMLFFFKIQYGEIYIEKEDGRGESIFDFKIQYGEIYIWEPENGGFAPATFKIQYGEIYI